MRALNSQGTSRTERHVEPAGGRLSKSEIATRLRKEVVRRHDLASHRHDDDHFAPVGGSIDTRFPSAGFASLDDCDAQFRAAVATVDHTHREQATEGFRAGIDLCRSVAARRIFAWLICQRYSFFVPNPQVLFAGETAKLRPYTVAVLPRFKIGRHEVDFALAMMKKEGPARFVLVDCTVASNGDDEIARARYERDAVRLRELLAYERVMGALVIDGRDIGRSPKMAAEACARFVHTCMFAKGVKMTNFVFPESRKGGDLFSAL